MRLISSTTRARRPSERRLPEKIGSPRSLHTAFYFPFSDRNNIRFDPKQEPMTALGDMAWYSMRAVVEYLRPDGRITKVVTAPERDPKTSAIVRASGLIAFDGGEVSTFDVGYTAGTIIMDLQLLGTTGVIGMDDFVLDWAEQLRVQESGDQSRLLPPHRDGDAQGRDVRSNAVAAPPGSGDDRRLRRTGEFPVTLPNGPAMQAHRSRRRSIWMRSGLQRLEAAEYIPHAGTGEPFVGWVQPTAFGLRPVGCTHPTIPHDRRRARYKLPELSSFARRAATLVLVQRLRSARVSP